MGQLTKFNTENEDPCQQNLIKKNHNEAKIAMIITKFELIFFLTCYSQKWVSKSAENWAPFKKIKCFKI